MSFTFSKKIPVSIVGGFLGTGKTTLVNYLIRHATKRFAVIVNEFGTTGIDGALIENLSEENLTEFTGGCICCSGREDLAIALYNLAMQAEPPEHILIELSGLADPVPIAQTILDPQLRALFELDGIIGVADARHLYQTLQDCPEGAVQLAYANCVVLNKTDLANQEQLETARQLIKHLNPICQIVETSEARVPLDLLSLGTFDQDFSSHEHIHSQGMVSFVLESAKPLIPLKWNAFCEEYILSRPAQVLRCKGFLSYKYIDQEILFQSVREIVRVERSNRPYMGHSSLVVIGRNLDVLEYQTQFKEITA